MNDRFIIVKIDANHNLEVIAQDLTRKQVIELYEKDKIKGLHFVIKAKQIGKFVAENIV